MDNSFMLDIIAALNKQLSAKSIKGDLKTLDNKFYIKVLAKLSKTLATKELQNQLKKLNNLYVQVGANVKIDKDAKNKLQKNIQMLQSQIADLEIGLKASKTHQVKINSEIAEIRKRLQSKINSEPLEFNLELKKSKIISDIEYLGKRYSKLFSNTSASKKYENLMQNALSITDKGQLAGTRTELAAFTSELKANGLASRSTGDKWRDLVDRSKDLFSAAAAVRVVFSQMRQAISTTISLDKVYTDLIKVQDDLTRSDYPDYLNKCNKKAQELATTQQALIESATEFSKSGFDSSKSDALSERSIKLANVGDMSASDSAKAIISGVQAYDTIDGYDDAIEKADALIDKYNEIGNTASITTEEIAKGVQSVGSVFADANTSVDEFIALLSAGNRQFQDADSLALGLRTSALRIRGCSAELEAMGEETDGVITSTSKLTEKIEALTNINGNGGVKILENDEQTFRSIYDVYVDIGKVYKQMSDTDQSALLELIAGKHRASGISAVLNNMAEAQEILQNSLNATGSAEKEYEKYLESAEAHINQFKAKLVGTYSTFMNGDTIKFAADFGTAMLDILNKTDLLRHGLLAIASIKLGQGVSTIGLSIADAAKQMNTLGSALQQVKNLPLDSVLKTNVLTSVGLETKNLTDKNLKLLLSQEQLLEKDKIRILLQHNLTEEEARAKLEKMGLISATNAQTAANTANTTSTFTLSGALTALKASAIGAGQAIKAAFWSNPIGFALMGITTVISAFSTVSSNCAQAQEELRQATQEAAQAYKSSAESISDYTKRYEELHTALLKAKGHEEETYNIKKQLLELQTELNDKYGEEYGKLNLVTDAYKDHTDAIREYNKEAANKYLNENEKGIRQARRDMESVDPYNLSYTGLSEYTDEGKILKELAEQYEDLGVRINKDNETGLFSIHLEANAEDAYEVINAFTTDLRKMSADLDETLFTSTFDLLSKEIGNAKKIIDRSGEQHYSGLEAEIKVNDNLSAEYEKATLAVEAYNEAVLQSENPYDDENVKKAYDDLQLVKRGIQENEEEWGEYSSVMDKVFSSADTKQYEFFESLKPQISSLKSEFEGLSNLELRSMASASDNDAFNKLAESAKEYGIEVDGLIDLLVQLGIAQSDVSDFQFEDAPRWDLSTTIEQLSEMKSALSTVDQAFAKLYDKDQQIGFDDFAAISEAFKGMDGIDDFISRLQDAGQDTEKVTSVMEDLIGTYLEFSGILDNVTDENQGLIVSMLEEMGVANASEIVNLALANSHIEVAVQKIMNANASFDLATATAEEINKMIEEAGESDIVRQKLALLALQKQLCNQTTIMTDGDIQNLQALARQAGATSAAIAAIKNTNAKLTKYEHYYKRNPEKAEKLWQETYDGIYNSIPNKTQLDFKQAKNSSGSPYAPRYSGGPSTQKAIKSAANDAAKAAKKAKEEFKELFDFFERRVKVLDDAFDLLKANLDNVVGAFAKNNLIDAQVGILDEKMKNYTDATAMYTQKANESLSKLDAGLQEKVKNGAVDLSTFVGDGNEEVVEAIKDYQNWADKIADCKQELAELKQKIRELELEKFNNIIEDFTNQFDLYGDSVDLIGKQIDLFKEAGMMIGESFYSVQKQQSEKQLATLEAEKAKLTEQLTSALSSGRIQQGTDEWLEMVNALTDVEGGILDCKKAIEEFDNAILDLHWEVFQRIQDTFSNLKSEMQNIIGVIDDMDVADEKGNWTKEGLTQLGLYAQQMELARYQVEQYNREINQLNADYLAGRYSVTEYTDKLAELSSAQWDAVNSVESAKDAIKDLNEARIEIAIDGINKEIDAYEKLIKARIDALIAAKNLHDYEQLIAEKTANITKLEKQIAAMQNDNTAATVAKRKLLEEQLAQARKELEDAEYEHSMQAQEDALNKELEDYRAAREAEIEALRASLEEKEILIAQSLETVKANTSVIAQEITMIAQMHGIQVSEAIINPWYSGQNAIASYGETLSAGTSAFIGQIIGVENQVYQLQADANNTANSLAYMFATRADNLVDQI